MLAALQWDQKALNSLTFGLVQNWLMLRCYLCVPWSIHATSPAYPGNSSSGILHQGSALLFSWYNMFYSCFSPNSFCLLVETDNSDFTQDAGKQRGTLSAGGSTDLIRWIVIPLNVCFVKPREQNSRKVFGGRGERYGGSPWSLLEVTS